MFKRNWYLFTPLILVIIPALLLAHYMANHGYDFSEAREAVQYFVQSSTRYSKGYSDEKFRRIQPGMDGRKVFEAVGVPFERHDNDTKWIYSLAKGTTTHYHERLVLFERDKADTLRVKTVVKRFHTPD